MSAHFLEGEKFLWWSSTSYFSAPNLEYLRIRYRESQIFFFCMLFSFIFWFCFWYCFKYSCHRWCGHAWHLFKPCLLAHDFLQKGQIHVVSIEYAKLSVFQTWIESFYCNWFPIHIFYFIHSFSFILWYCFEHFCHRWSGHDWKNLPILSSLVC